LSGKESIYVVVPALNEAGTVAGVVAGAYAHGATRVVVVDDVSHDDTARRARGAGAVVLSPVIRLGAWGAAQAGLRYAVRCGADVAVTMDADGQHPAERIGELVEPITLDRADVVIGACTERGSKARKFAWKLFKRLTGIGIEDLTSGFRAYNRKALDVLARPEATLIDYQDIGVLLLLEHAGLRIVERKVPMCARPNGKSRIFHSWLAVGRYMLASIVLGLSKSRHAGRIKRYKPDTA